jgi:hypothetical protein
VINAVFFFIGALSLLAAVVKAADGVRGGWQPGHGMLIGTFTALCVACVALSYIVQKAADHLYPQLGRLVSNLAVMTAALALLLIQLNLSYPADGFGPRLRRRLMLFAAAVITMTWCFGAAGPLPARLGDFGGLYRTQPVLLVYIGVYIAFLGTALGELLLLSVRYARVARHRRYLHAGLLMLAAGSVLGLAYLAEKIVYVAAEAVPFTPPLGTDQHCTSPVTPGQCGFEITVTGTAILASAIGATLPVWGPVVAAPLGTRWQVRTYARLEPLWSALYAAFPQIALAPESQSQARQRADPGFLLYRRVIEILDGLLLLTPYRDPRSTPPAHADAPQAARASDRTRTEAEAAEIAAALRAHHEGAPVYGPGQVAAWAREDRSDLRAEARWLAGISRRMASTSNRSPNGRGGSPPALTPPQPTGERT